MSINYGYYLPLNAAEMYKEVRFLDISPKTDGVGELARQTTDNEGTPKWVVSTLVKYKDLPQQTETFTLVASQADAEKINLLADLTPIRLLNLLGGKWSKAGADKTSWSFQISGVEVAK